MQGCKKLFQRDKIFLLCLSGIVFLALLFGLLQCHNIIRQDMELLRTFRELYGVEILGDLGFSASQMVYGMTEYAITGVMKAVFAVVVIAQFIKWNVLEGKQGKEFQNFLPVKSSACVTYDYVCGILFLWVPAVIMGMIVSIMENQYKMEEFFNMNMNFNIGNIWSEVGREIIVVSCIYSFLVFAKKITRYIPGILLVLPICCYAVWFLGNGSSVLWDWGFHNAGKIWEYMAFLALIPVFVLSSYFCDRKRDIAGNGLFYFKSVHFLFMLIIFAELFGIFDTSVVILVPFGVAADIISLILAAAVTTGMHYLTWGKKGKVTKPDEGRKNNGRRM